MYIFIFAILTLSLKDCLFRPPISSICILNSSTWQTTPIYKLWNSFWFCSISSSLNKVSVQKTALIIIQITFSGILTKLVATSDIRVLFYIQLLNRFFCIEIVKLGPIFCGPYSSSNRAMFYMFPSSRISDLINVSVTCHLFFFLNLWLYTILYCCHREFTCFAFLPMKFPATSLPLRDVNDTALQVLKHWVVYGSKIKFSMRHYCPCKFFILKEIVHSFKHNLQFVCSNYGSSQLINCKWIFFWNHSMVNTYSLSATLRNYTRSLIWYNRCKSIRTTPPI
jgi:hypothetical protein